MTRAWLVIPGVCCVILGGLAYQHWQSVRQAEASRSALETLYDVQCYFTGRHSDEILAIMAALTVDPGMARVPVLKDQDKIESYGDWRRALDVVGPDTGAFGESVRRRFGAVGPEELNPVQWELLRFLSTTYSAAVLQSGCSAVGTETFNTEKMFVDVSGQKRLAGGPYVRTAGFLAATERLIPGAVPWLDAIHVAPGYPIVVIHRQRSRRDGGFESYDFCQPGQFWHDAKKGCDDLKSIYSGTFTCTPDNGRIFSVLASPRPPGNSVR